jgi:hypothetical protein
MERTTWAKWLSCAGALTLVFVLSNCNSNDGIVLPKSISQSVGCTGTFFDGTHRYERHGATPESAVKHFLLDGVSEYEHNPALPMTLPTSNWHESRLDSNRATFYSAGNELIVTRLGRADWVVVGGGAAKRGAICVVHLTL